MNMKYSSVLKIIGTGLMCAATIVSEVAKYRTIDETIEDRVDNACPKQIEKKES